MKIATRDTESKKLTFSKSDYSVTSLTFDQVSDCRLDTGRLLQWECLFMEPAWMQAWWSHFGTGMTPCILAVWHKKTLIGIAPLMADGTTACLLGHSDLCDYMDFVIAPQRGPEFFTVIIEYLQNKGFVLLDLKPVLGESNVVKDLVEIAPKLGCRVVCKPDNVTYAMELPSSWEKFLKRLSGKQRHEIRRKLRRLDAAGQVKYRIIEDVDAVRTEIDIFMALFRSNRPDKAAFMTSQMEAYFRSLAASMAAHHMLRLAFLELDGQPAAAAMCFDDHSTVYLYNSGYDLSFSSLSVGLLSKVLSIKDSILRGRRKYDFLKGDEKYKRYLGGRPLPLFSYRIHLSP
ncbi:MAG: GNAT family N-acetyltransferase [Candidatus Desulfatibia sp.]|uniref:GNAT family N-acetyltransferase n=1 Tax=Candidatus Desulfatibia sp. TaxID=3101189 RepID=UPI002F2DEDFE